MRFIVRRAGFLKSASSNAIRRSCEFLSFGKAAYDEHPHISEISKEEFLNQAKIHGLPDPTFWSEEWGNLSNDFESFDFKAYLMTGEIANKTRRFLYYKGEDKPDISLFDAPHNSYVSGDYFKGFFDFLDHYDEYTSESKAHRRLRLSVPWLFDVVPSIVSTGRSAFEVTKQVFIFGFLMLTSLMNFVEEQVVFGVMNSMWKYLRDGFSGERNLVDHISIATGFSGLAYSTRFVSREGLKFHIGGLLLVLSGMLGLADLISKSPFMIFAQQGVVSQSDEDNDGAVNVVNVIFSYLSGLCKIPPLLSRAIRGITTGKHSVKDRIKDLIIYSKFVFVLAGPGVFDDVENWLFDDSLRILMELDRLSRDKLWTTYMGNELSRSNYEGCLTRCYEYFNASCWDVGPAAIRSVVTKHRKTIIELKKTFNNLQPIITNHRFETIGLFFSGPSGIAKSGLLLPHIRHIVDFCRDSSGASSTYPTQNDWGAAVSVAHLTWDDCQSTFQDLEPIYASEVAKKLMNLLSVENLQPDVDRVDGKGSQVKAETLCMTSNNPFNQIAFVHHEAITSRIDEWIIVPNAMFIGSGPNNINHETWRSGVADVRQDDPISVFIWRFLDENFHDDSHFLMRGFTEVFRTGERSVDFDPVNYFSELETFTFRKPDLTGRAKGYFTPAKGQKGFTANFSNDRGNFVTEYTNSAAMYRNVVEGLQKFTSLQVNALMSVIGMCAYSVVRPKGSPRLDYGHHVTIAVCDKWRSRNDRYVKSNADDPVGIIWVSPEVEKDAHSDVLALAKKAADHVRRPKVAAALLFLVSCLCLYFYMRPKEATPESQSQLPGFRARYPKGRAVYQQSVNQSDELQAMQRNAIHIGTSNRILAKGLVLQPFRARGVWGHLIVMTYHSFENLKRMTKSKLYFSRASDPGVRFDFTVNNDTWLYPVRLDTDIDVVYIFACHKTMSVNFKDVSARVYPENEPLGEVELMYHASDGSTSYVVGRAVPSKNYHSDVVNITNGKSETPYDASKIFCVDLSIYTMAGMCGTVAVSTDSGPNVGKILGVHIGGDSKRAYYARIMSVPLEEVNSGNDLRPSAQGESVSNGDPRPSVQGESIDDFGLSAYRKGESQFPVTLQPCTFVLGHLHHYMSAIPSVKKTRTTKTQLWDDFSSLLPAAVSSHTSDVPLKYPSGMGFDHHPYVEMGQRIVLSRENSFCIDRTAGAAAFDDLVFIYEFEPSKQFVLDYREAVFGSTGPHSRLTHLQKVDHSTSVGPTLQMEHSSTSRRSDFLLNRDDKQFISPGKKMDSFIIDHVNVVEADLASGSYRYSVVANWKSELLPYGKTPRAFYVGDLADLIVVRRLFGSFLDHMLRTRIHNGSAIGSNCYGADWDFIRDRLRGPLCTDLDISKMEYRAYNNEISEYIQRFFFDFYDGSDDNYISTSFKDDRRGVRKYSAAVMRRSFLKSIVKPFLHYRGSIYQGMDFNPSGHPLTAALNTLVLQFHYRHAFYSLCLRQELNTWEYPFHMHVKDVCMGDDCVLSVSEKVHTWFSPLAIRDFMSELDITITAAKKDEELCFKELSCCTFLKREFFEDKEGNLRARLHMDTLLNLMVWNVRRPVKERKASVIDAILIEATLWGPEVFNWYYKCIKLSLNYTRDTQIKVSSYDSYVARMAGNDRV